jgi:hypothetical protein
MDQAGLEIQVVLVPGLARAGGREVGAAVIGVVAGNDVLLVRPAQVVVEEPDEAQGGIHGRRAACGEEHVVEVARRQVRELLCQPGARYVAQAPGAVIGQGPDLLGHRLGDFSVAVAYVDAPHARRPVDHLFAVGVVDVDALGAGDDRALGRGVGTEAVPGVDPVPILCAGHFGIELQFVFHRVT